MSFPFQEPWFASDAHDSEIRLLSFLVAGLIDQTVKVVGLSRTLKAHLTY